MLISSIPEKTFYRSLQPPLTLDFASIKHFGVDGAGLNCGPQESAERQLTAECRYNDGRDGPTLMISFFEFAPNERRHSLILGMGFAAVLKEDENVPELRSIAFHQ